MSQQLFRLHVTKTSHVPLTLPLIHQHRRSEKILSEVLRDLLCSGYTETYVFSHGSTALLSQGHISKFP